MSITNPSQAIQQIQRQNADPTNFQNVSIAGPSITGLPQIPKLIDQVNSSLTRLSKINVPPGAVPMNTSAAKTSFSGQKKDLRPRLIVPEYYTQSMLTAGPDGIITATRGIFFPYTPTITQDYTASYAQQSVIHSNYSINFFRNSTPGDITVSAPFSVQSDRDAVYYLAMTHLLRSLIKMQFGTDANAGVPPPVCRFYAYGSHMFDNVPVVVKQFTIKLDKEVHYYQLDQDNMVPTKSEIAITLTPVYSRDEMKNFSVSQWLNGNLRPRGYL
jgi:hypothetical protein